LGYVSDTGTRIGHHQLRSLALTFCTACEIDLERNAQLLASGEQTVDEWHDLAQQITTDEIILLAALGAGGLDELTDQDYATIEGEVTPDDGTTIGSGTADADDRLARFKSELSQPSPEDAETPQMGIAGSEKQVVNRAGSYAKQYSIYEKSRGNSHIRNAQANDLQLEMKNILDDAARHCLPTAYTEGCGEVTRLGWVPAGSISFPGERTCAQQCLCSTAWRVLSKTGQEVVSP
jgi:hypothetical protein